MIDTVKLIQGVDRVPETAGMGIYVIEDGSARIVRPPKPGATSYVVFSVATGAGRTQSSQGKNAHMLTELWSAGVSCGGAVISGIGVVGAAALAPETGGLSLAGEVLLWSGMTASASQCLVSAYRVGNAATGRESVNQSLDESMTYKTSMYVLDGVGLIGAGGAIKEFAVTEDVLKEAGISWEAAKTGGLSRQSRLAITQGLEIQTAKRLPTAVINRIVKQRLLDVTGAALGIAGSGSTDGGVVHDVGIWIVTKPPAK